MTKNIIVTAVVALVVSVVVGLFFVGQSSQSNSVQDLGGLSERDIKATSLKVGSPTTKFTVNGTGTLVSIGTSTPQTTGELVVDGSGTTTLMLKSSTSTKGGCIEMETVTGGVVRITVTGTTISAVAGVCK